MDESTSQVEYTVAGNMGNMIGQLSLQIAQLQTVVQQKNAEIEKNQNIIAELQQQIKGLRGEKVARSTNTADKQGKH
ncbi:hypothetical protein VKX94_01995 [Lactobacillus helveticus]|uniref:Uncharacterized protein n=1 Tax=Lactobacillus helveticus CIRM-BIA 951 TaxID=1226334 RepID=U6F7R4_LACHE|nr:hypothetical protein [Lactobacillus helveticus]MDY0990895.1 hypothetical protein [Lactobacillus helveticus]MDY1001606.1 hypothetical protein [Lactobacillus helveticus]MEB2873416.1 hypothetical protein [Lactobacillus helveticus]CDI58605.1 Putative uncharacterized protein [Lactobacillus helveticus CIRM-BIA 951]